MEFKLTTDDPLNTSLVDAFGREHYRTTTTYHAFPSPAETILLCRPHGESGMTVLAKIIWRSSAPPTIRYRGRELLVDDRINRRTHFGLHGNFKASDMLPYEWSSGNWMNDLRLETHDLARTHIAASSRQSGRRLPASRRTTMLTISPAGLHILDDIVLTFIYMDHIRIECSRPWHCNCGRNESRPRNFRYPSM